LEGEEMERKVERDLERERMEKNVFNIERM
jgi:hypothetical protein